MRNDVDNAIAMLEAMYGVDVHAVLGDIAIPVQAIYGALDPMPSTSVSDASEMVVAVHDARVHVVDGAVHVPTLTRPAEVAEVMAGFIGSLAT